MTKLNDTQLILLSTAAQPDSGSLFPLPHTTTAMHVGKAVAGLSKRGLIENEIPETHPSHIAPTAIWGSACSSPMWA